MVQTETTMVSATFTKHLVIIATNIHEASCDYCHQQPSSFIQILRCFHISVRGQPSWSEQCQALVIFSLLWCQELSATTLHRFTKSKVFNLLPSHSGLQANKVPCFCRHWHQQLKKYLDKDKTKCIDKDKPLIPGRATHATIATMMPLLRHAYAALTQHWHSSHA